MDEELKDEDRFESPKPRSWEELVAVIFCIVVGIALVIGLLTLKALFTGTW